MEVPLVLIVLGVREVDNRDDSLFSSVKEGVRVKTVSSLVYVDRGR